MYVCDRENTEFRFGIEQFFVLNFLHAHEPNNKQTRIEYCEKQMHFMKLNKICKSCGENQQKQNSFENSQLCSPE